MIGARTMPGAAAAARRSPTPLRATPKSSTMSGVAGVTRVFAMIPVMAMAMTIRNGGGDATEPEEPRTVLRTSPNE